MDIMSLLLGQQNASAASQGINPAAQDPNQILVQAAASGAYDPRRDPQRPVVNDTPTRQEIDPRYVLNDNRVSPHKDDLGEIIPREGMFGVKGTLRDVLGILGDSFLTQSGNQRVYQPQREAEKQADATFGFTENPLQAIERLAAAGYGEEAQALQQQVANQQYNQGILQNQQENTASNSLNRQSLIDDRSLSNFEGVRNYAARLLNAGLTSGSAEGVQAALRQAELTAQRAGVTLEELGVFEGMTPEQMAVFAAGDMTVNQQEQLPRRDRQLNISQQNADTASRNSRRPAAGRNPTEASELTRIRNRINAGNELNQGDQQTWDRYINGTRGSDNALPPPPPPGGQRTQGWSVRPR